MQMDVLRQQIGKYRLWTSNVVQDTHTRHIQEADLIQEVDQVQEADQDQEVDQIQRVCLVWEVDLAVHLHTLDQEADQEVDQEAEADQEVDQVAEAEVDQVLHLVTFQAILL